MDIVALFEFHQTECNVTLNQSVWPLLYYYDGSKAWSLLDAQINVLAVTIWLLVLVQDINSRVDAYIDVLDVICIW